MKGIPFSAMVVLLFLPASLSWAACPPPPGSYVMTFQPDPSGTPSCPDLVSNQINIVGVSTAGPIQGFGFNIFLTGNIQITAITAGFVVGPNGAFLGQISGSGMEAAAMGVPGPGAPGLGTLATITLSPTGPGPYGLSFGGTFALTSGIVPVDHLVVGGCDADSSTLPMLQTGGGPLRCPEFIRSDCNNNGKTAGYVGDIVFLLDHLFLGGGPVECESACDANDSGTVDISDSIWMIAWQFLGSSPPPPPFGPFPGGCGTDPTPDSLTCLNPICP